MKKKLPPAPPVIPHPAAPPADPNIAKILAIVTENNTIVKENNERLKALAQNIGFLTDLVNDLNIRMIHVENQLIHIEHQLKKVLRILEQLLEAVVPEVKDFQLTQGDNMPITGVNAGASADFTVLFVPANGVALQSGPTVTSSDTLVTIGPAAVNPSAVRFSAAVDASDANPSFQATVTGVNGAGAAISHVFTIPILPGAPVQIVDFDLSQD